MQRHSGSILPTFTYVDSSEPGSQDSAGAFDSCTPHIPVPSIETSFDLMSRGGIAHTFANSKLVLLCWFGLSREMGLSICYIYMEVDV